jgi:hypothetical protein
MTGTCAAGLHTNQSRSYLNHLVYAYVDIGMSFFSFVIVSSCR